MTFHQGLTRAQGDPGFFSSLGGLIGKVAKFIPGPIGAAAGLIFDKPGDSTFIPQQPLGPQTVPASPVPGFGGAVQRFLPGGKSGFECPPGSECPTGFRKNKSSYFLRDGTFVMPGSRCVRIRRINPGNGRAVRRAIRRENSFVKLAVGTGLVAVPKAKRVRKAAGKSRR